MTFAKVIEASVTFRSSGEGHSWPGWSGYTINEMIQVNRDLLWVLYQAFQQNWSFNKAILNHYDILLIDLSVNVQKRPKKWTLIILVSSSMENVGADRAPGMVEKFRLTAVSWSRTITVLSSHATNNEGKGRYVLEEFSICSFTDYKKVGKLLSCRKYYRYRVILTKTFLYVDSFTRVKLCNNPFVKTTLHLWSVPRRSTSFNAKFSKLM